MKNFCLIVSFLCSNAYYISGTIFFISLIYFLKTFPLFNW